MGFQVEGVHHLTLNVTDLERSKAFYAGVLGFVIDQDFPGSRGSSRSSDAGGHLYKC